MVNSTMAGAEVGSENEGRPKAGVPVAKMKAYIKKQAADSSAERKLCDRKSEIAKNLVISRKR
jgi:hypothetical protein